jgi:pimeloyl-ACP methyl ester carboxylesterase
MPEAKIHIIENCGHLPHAEKADEFVDLVCR